MYSPFNCEGIGLSDGEVMEQMWSYWRRFSKMTKEMRPSHRIDVLMHALLHYGHLTKLKLRKIHVVILLCILQHHFFRTVGGKLAVSQETFQSLCDSLPGIFYDDMHIGATIGAAALNIPYKVKKTLFTHSC